MIADVQKDGPYMQIFTEAFNSIHKRHQIKLFFLLVFLLLIIFIALNPNFLKYHIEVYIVLLLKTGIVIYMTTIGIPTA